jgi:molybdopterin synthase catalytic subunit
MSLDTHDDQFKDLIKLTTNVLDPRLIETLIENPSYGAIVTFSGRVRNHHEGEDVYSLRYEAYDIMVLKSFEDILQEASQHFAETQSTIHHRIGTLAIGDIAVVICTGSAHRAPAFAANSWIIEQIKKKSPIFKHEERNDGRIWVGLGS